MRVLIFFLICAPLCAEMTVRRLQRRDIPAIKQIEIASYGEDAWNDADLKRATEHAEFSYVALDGDKVVGVLFIEDLAHEAVIENLVVHPDHRKKGHANRLLDRAKTDMRALAQENGRDPKYIVADLEKTDEAQRALIRSHGFSRGALGRGRFHGHREAETGGRFYSRPFFPQWFSGVSFGLSEWLDLPPHPTDELIQEAVDKETRHFADPETVDQAIEQHILLSPELRKAWMHPSQISETCEADIRALRKKVVPAVSP